MPFVYAALSLISMARYFFEFYAIVNINVTILILGRRLYLPRLKDAALSEDAQLIFPIFHAFDLSVNLTG